MPLWGKSDAASNSTLFALAQLNKTANSDNQTALFGNTTADAFISGATVGQFGSDANEVQAARAAGAAGPRSPGWSLKTTVGSRVRYETLVAMSHASLVTDASDDATLPDYTLAISTQPANDSANVTASEAGVFTVVAASTPPGATLSYDWQANTSGSFASVTDGAVYTGQNTASLSVDDVTGLNGAQYRVVISATGAANLTSSVATLTVTS